MCQAKENGAVGVEFDVDFTSDGKCVVIHDDDIDRTTDGEGYVCDMTLSELRKFNTSREPGFIYISVAIIVTCKHLMYFNELL